MPKGDYQKAYFDNPYVHHIKSMDAIYADLDAFTMEYFSDEPEFVERIDLVVVLPPPGYDGKFIKGICFSQGPDFLLERYPRLGEIFHVIANSQWAAIPWSRGADALFVKYDNPLREEWFRRTYPDRHRQILLPLQDNDFTNEYVMAPVPFLPRDIDVRELSIEPLRFSVRQESSALARTWSERDP
jgi:hypothetical protein